MRPLVKSLSDRVKGSSNRIFIFFTHNGLLFLLCLFLLFLISITYGNSMAYLSLFLFFSTLSISAIVTNENLRNVELIENHKTIRGIAPFNPSFGVKNLSSSKCWSINVEINDQFGTISELDNRDIQFVQAPLELPSGLYHLKKIRLSTDFPFSLFQSWKNYKVNCKIIVLPRPINHLAINFPLSDNEEYAKSAEGEFLTLSKEEDIEFNKIDWKHYAKTDELMTKIYDDQIDRTILVNDYTLKGLDAKEQCEQIHFWIKEAISNAQKWHIQLKEYDSGKCRGFDELEESLEKLMEMRFEYKSI